MPRWIACNVCKSETSQFLFKTYDRLLDLPGEYCFVQCNLCGLVYVNPQPTWSERAAHYAASYSGYHSWQSESSFIQKLGMSYGLYKRNRIITSFRKTGRLLDVGSGNGDFVQWLQKRSKWQAVAVEHSSQLASPDRPSPIHTIQGDLNQLSFPAKSFDVVSMWTVLEHLSDPRQGLRECWRILRSEGHLIYERLYKRVGELTYLAQIG